MFPWKLLKRLHPFGTFGEYIIGMLRRRCHHLKRFGDEGIGHVGVEQVGEGAHPHLFGFGPGGGFVEGIVEGDDLIEAIMVLRGAGVGGEAVDDPLGGAMGAFVGDVGTSEGEVPVFEVTISVWAGHGCVG